MATWDSITVIGVGMIGGSIGCALRERGLAKRVVGVGRRESSLQTAQDCGAIDQGFTDIASGVAEAELVIACTPVGQIADHLLTAAKHAPSGVLLTDAGSTKAHICSQMQESPDDSIRFVGSHPLAGSEKAGPGNANPNLFESKTVVITPTDQTQADDVAAIEKFWQALGAVTIQQSPTEHDAAVAATSHMPHVVASALAAGTKPEHLPLAASGWLDTTRIAAGDVELWKQILSDNRENVIASLQDIQTLLSEFETALQQDDQNKISNLLQLGKQNRDALGS